MQSILLVALGGGAGAVTRYLVSQLLSWMGVRSGLWSGTLVVNLIGCFLIGWAIQWMETRDLLASGLYLLLITGFLGGFTTYSSFGLEGLTLLKSSPTTFLLYTGIHLIAGLFLVWAGYQLSSLTGAQ